MSGFWPPPRDGSRPKSDSGALPFSPASSDARTAAAIDQIGGQIKVMPPHRIFAPDVEVLGRAALLSGILCRLRGYEKDGRLRALQDCVLFLQARKLGLVALTANVGDYDILLQLIPTGRALFYRRK